MTGPELKIVIKLEFMEEIRWNTACPSRKKCVKIDKEMKGEMICVHFLSI